jgi:hypothetical protein
MRRRMGALLASGTTSLKEAAKIAVTQVTFARTLGSNFFGARGFSKTESPCAEVLAARKGLRLSADSVELDSDHCTPSFSKPYFCVSTC